MRKIFFIALFQMTAFIIFAQQDSSRIEQYCQVVATPRLLSNRVTIDLDFGEEKRFWSDTRLRNFDGQVKKFNTIIDALNFMGREGWTFINAYPVRYSNTEVYHFGFKKQFLKSELQDR